MVTTYAPAPSRKNGNGSGSYAPYLTSDAPRFSASSSFNKHVEEMAQMGIYIAKTHGEKTQLDKTSQLHEYYGHGDNFNIKYTESIMGASKLEIMFNGAKSFSVAISNSQISEVEVCLSNPKFVQSVKELCERLGKKSTVELRN